MNNINQVATGGMNHPVHQWQRTCLAEIPHVRTTYLETTKQIEISQHLSLAYGTPNDLSCKLMTSHDRWMRWELSDFPDRNGS